MQAEAVLGTIEANDHESLRIALDQLAGGLSMPLNRLRGDLMDLLADLEGGLDFADEDIRFVSSIEVRERLAAAQSTMDKLSERIGVRAVSQPERRVVLTGWPNVGKSALFNALVGCDAAIVSPQSGTTRDYLQRHIALRGAPCLLVDTAGVDSASDGIDSAAQHFANQQRASGDIVLLCLDASRPINQWENEQLTARQADIVVWTKCDLPRQSENAPYAAIETSAVTRHGWEELRAEIANRANDCRDHEAAVASTSARCQESVVRARGAIDQAVRLAAEDAGEELVASEVRVALGELGKVVGAVYTDDLLDRIFSRFCIGK
jgi:tRNA modification GTPase